MTEDPRRGTSPSIIQTHSNGSTAGRPVGLQPRVLRRAGRIDPNSIDDYISQDGYAALRQVVTGQSPEAVIAEVGKSGLRGRGGHGIETASKWGAVAASSSADRYVVANAFGADPTAHGDRLLLENDPHAVLEGLAIAAYAVGANKGFVYCCLNSREALRLVRQAVRQAEDRGFLGSAVLGTSFGFHVSVVAGPAGFAAGEETAAVAVIEGQRPMPSPRALAKNGLWGKPTVVNNAETLCNIPWIVLNGPDQFKAVGSQANWGTKLITLTGRLNRPGVVEVPFGVTFVELLEQYGGGLRSGHQVKAVQVGGPHGALYSPAMLEGKLEFEALRAARTVLAGGSVLVLDEEACILDFVHSRIQLLASECCGRCVPGRIGMQRILFLVEQIASGEGRAGDLDVLGELCQNVSDGAACGFGVAGPNSALSALRYFRPELETHIVDKRCPAGRCALTPSDSRENREEHWRRTWPIRR